MLRLCIVFFDYLLKSVVERAKSKIGATIIQVMNAYKTVKNNSFLPWIVSSFEYFPHSSFQKRIVSAETIRGNTVGSQTMVLYQMTTKRWHLQAKFIVFKNVYLQDSSIDLDTLSYFTLMSSSSQIQSF